ncbi:MAG: protein-export chaperone SecB [Gammaproteobacteria bacterium]
MAKKKVKTEAVAEESGTTQLKIEKIYLKDLSFEVPNSPKIFTAKVDPEVKFNIATKHKQIGPENFEVVLSTTLQATHNEDVAFLAEVQQAGIFTIKGVPENAMDQLLEVYCPGVLYPYAREAISEIVQKGGFPQLLLQPVNFEALNRAKEAGTESGDTA